MTTKEQFAIALAKVREAIHEMHKLRSLLNRKEDKLSAREILDGIEDDYENLLWLKANYSQEDLYISEI